MAFGPPPDISGNIAVAAICASTCDSHTPQVQPNPNGAYPGVMGGQAVRAGGVGAGNGSAGSPAMGFPVTYCKSCPRCKTCEEAMADSGKNSVPDKNRGFASH